LPLLPLLLLPSARWPNSDAGALGVVYLDMRDPGVVVDFGESAE